MALRRSVAGAVLVAALAASLTGCGGGGGSSPAFAPVARANPSGGGSGAATTGSLVLSLPVTVPSATQRSPRFLSPSSTSVVIGVNGTTVATADVSPTSTLCTTSGTTRSCTVTFSAPAGNDTLTVDLYDGPNGTGKHLATGTTSLAVVAGTPFTAAVQMRGIVASVTVAVNGSLTSGTAATLPLTVTALDADGNAIGGSGAFAAPVTLSQSDTSGHIALSATSLASAQTAVNLVYDGTAIGAPGTTTTITVSATGSGISATPASVTLSTPARNVLTNGDFSNGLAGWTTGAVVANGTYPRISTSTAAPCYQAQNGNQFAYIDSPLGSDGYFQQTFTVPMTANPTLTFRTWGNLDPVTTSIRIIQSGTETVLDRFTPPPLQASPTTCSGAAAVTKTYSLAEFAGQTVTLRVRSSASGYNGTIADFDDFAIQ